MASFHDLWQKYQTAPHVLLLTNDIVKTFSEPFTEAFETQYEVDELIYDFVVELVFNKHYDVAIAFELILSACNPHLYEGYSDYIFDSILARYYCFTKDKAQLNRRLQKVVENLGTDQDYLLNTTLHLLSHGYSDLADLLIETNYKEVVETATSRDIPFALAQMKLAIELEKVHAYYQAHKNFAWPAFNEVMNAYGFELTERFFRALGNGLGDSFVYTYKLLKKFPPDKTRIMLTLEMLFAKMMLEKGCSLPISSLIWKNLHACLESRPSKNWTQYFTLNVTSFSNLVNDTLDYDDGLTTSTMYTLWGSSYFIDFVDTNFLIKAKRTHFAQQRSLIAQMKQQVKSLFLPNLWQYTFIHDWLPPSDIDAEAHEAERQEFIATYKIKPYGEQPIFDETEVLETLKGVFG